MRGRNVALAALAALLYAGCYAAIKAGLAYAPPFGFAALRSFIGGLLLLAFLGVTGQTIVPPRHLWIPTVLLAVVGSVLGFSAMFNSPLHTGAGLASVLGNTGPLLVIVLAAVFLGEPITHGKVTALVLATGGVALIAMPGAGSSASWHPTALALPLLAASSRAAENVIVKGMRLGRCAGAVAAWQFLLASAVLATLSAWLEPQSTTVWTMKFALLVALLAGGSTAVATALWYWLVQREEVSRLSLVLFLVPVAGLALGTGLFGERLTAVQLAGIALVFAGVAAVAFLENGRAGDAARAAPAGR